MTTPSVCAVAPEAYPALAEMAEGPIGGSEVQVALLLRELARRGHAVSLIAGDYGQEAETTIDGVRVIRSYPPGEGVRSLRYASDTLAVLRAMRRAGADVYLQRCVFHQTGRAYIAARLLGRCFAFSAGDAMNAWSASELRALRLPYRLTYGMAIRGADLVTCQNEEQRLGFERNYGVSAVVWPNMIDTSRYVPGEPRPAGERVVAVWAGTLSTRKRPEIVAELAALLPSIDFVLVEKPGALALDSRVERVLDDLPNVRRAGFVPHPRMPALLASCDVLISTSSSEGIPNVFLEAMATALPIVSLNVDPDGMLGSAGAGMSCDDNVLRMADVLAGLAEDRALRASLGESGLRYVREHHDSAVVGGRMGADLARVVGC